MVARQPIGAGELIIGCFASSKVRFPDEPYVTAASTQEPIRGELRRPVADIILQDNNGGMRRRPRSRLLAGEQHPSNLIYVTRLHGSIADVWGSRGKGGREEREQGGRSEAELS